MMISYGSMGRDEAECLIFDVPEAYEEITGRADEALGVVPLKSKWIFRIKLD